MPVNQSTDEFPIRGTDEQIEKAVRRAVKKALNKRKFKAASILPKTLINTVFVDRSYPTKRRYRRAFVQEKAAETLGSPKHHIPEIADINPLTGMGRRIMSEEDHRWETELAKLEYGNDNVIVWHDLPKDTIDAISEQQIPRAEWDSWATEFLVFSSKLWSLKATDKASKAAQAKLKPYRPL